MASLNTDSLLPAGIYRIVVAELGKIGPNALTRVQDGQSVSLLPPGAQPDEDQKWQVGAVPNGNITIVKPTGIRPAHALSHDGPLQEGSRVAVQVQDFPTEWRVGIAPGFRQTLHVANSQLGIRLSPALISPPILQLAESDQLFWVFERVGDNV